MGSFTTQVCDRCFTTQVCDRCKAHFPLEPNQRGERPVQQVKVNIWHAEEQIELCSPCRKLLNDLWRRFRDSTS